MNWMNRQVSLYNSHADNVGRPVSVGEVLFSDFAIPRKLKGRRVNDLETIIELRRLDRTAPDYKARKLDLKDTLQCYTPAGLLATKAKGQMTEISRSGLLQLDFDYQDIRDYDLEELKRCVFNLPFIGFCGLSCSGDGFYALALIAEPERLAEYAEHLFQVLLHYGIKADDSKGKKVENLRYLSYDANMLIRDNPEILHVKHFLTKPAPKKQAVSTYGLPALTGANALITSELNKIRNCITGSRWATIQKVAYTLGGLGDAALIYSIKSEIEANPEFTGEEEKYCKCAEDCFAAGILNPLKPMSQ